MVKMHRYTVALKREMWNSVSLRSAMDRIVDIPGVQIIGDLDGRRTVIETSTQAAVQIGKALSDWCYVEPEIIYKPQGTAST